MQCDLKKLKEAMIRRRWNRADLVRATGKAPSTIRRIFTHGTAHVDTIDAVSRALGIDYEEIVILEHDEVQTA